MSAFANLTAALAALGKPCVVLETGEIGLLASIQGDGRLECPAGFYRDLSEVGALPAVASIALVLTPTSIAVGAKSVGVVTATYSDSSTGVVPADLISGTPATATASGSELTGVAAGTTSVTAKFGGKTSPGVTLTVTA